MGGAPAGDRASTLAVTALEAAHPLDEHPAAFLARCFDAATAALAADIEAHFDHSGMGTTLVLALARGTEAWVAHAGDSRAYRWHAGRLQALTGDHNAAGEAVRAGTLDADAARDHPGRHLLTRAVGGRRADPEVAGPFALEPDSALLLVSDGVSGVLPHAELEALVAAHRCGDLVTALIDATLTAGAPDNLAVALLDRRC